jgi:hypothetical protein
VCVSLSFFFLFFVSLSLSLSLWIGTQGLALTRQTLYHWSHVSSPVLSHFPFKESEALRKEKMRLGQMKWRTSVIPATWESDWED